MSQRKIPSKDNKKDIVIKACANSAVMRSKDLTSLGVSREQIRRMNREGIIVRVSRGLYRLPDAEITAQHTIAEAAKRIPEGVVCLLSALRFHDTTTQEPFEVWMAIEVKAWSPKIPEIPLRIVRFSGASFQEGIEEHVVEGVTVRVYNLAKTVADCFKYRNKIGTEVAVEALKEVLRSKKVSIDDIWRYAKICRVANVIRPYLEAMT